MADKVNFQFTVVNGPFYSGTSAGAGKDAQARVSVRVLDTNDSSRVGGLRITGYAGYGRALAGDRNRFIGMISYRSKEITLAGEAAATQDGVLSATNGHVYSAFGVYKFPQTRSEEHTSELQSQSNLVCRLLLEKKNKKSDFRSCERCHL